MPMPEWLGITETLAFTLMVGTFGYNRLVSWKKFNDRTNGLESKFEIFTKDFDRYVSTCESCRSTIREHHEEAEIHVSPALTAMISRIADDVKVIQSVLMKMNGGSK